MDCHYAWRFPCQPRGGITYTHLSTWDDQADEHGPVHPSVNQRVKNIVLGVIIVGLSIVAVVALVLATRTSSSKTSSSGDLDCPICETDTTTSTPGGPAPPWGHARTAQFRYAAVATDTDVCSKIGTDVLGHLGGSATDAAVAAMLCVGVINMHSTGIGGGHFATIYDTPVGQSEKILSTIFAREVAPGASSRDMFVNRTGSSTYGGLAVGVPGEISGFYSAWMKFGRVAWSRLVIPSVHLCHEGFQVGHSLAYAVAAKQDLITDDPKMRELFVKSDGSMIAEGDIIKLPKLANTLQQIADDPMSFYNGSLASDIVQDLEEYDGIITREDLANYRTKEKSPVNVTLNNGNYTVNSLRPPSSGAVLQYIFNILDGYELQPSSANPHNIAETYQRIVEAFKFAFSKRSALGDEDFVNVTEILNDLTSRDFAEAIRVKINDSHTQDLLYYEPKFEIVQDDGTSHLSVLAPDGSAVSMTSTINHYFGAKVLGKRTGIFFNNEMDDFSTPGTVNSYGVPASPTNYIEPGKMPMSSMSPTIILDQDGNVVFVAGASGGTRIITATALVIINNLWLGKDIQDALDTGRIHHQLLPDILSVEPNIDQDLLDNLKSYGHQIGEAKKAIVQAIRSDCSDCQDDFCLLETCIHAACDARKDGIPDGF